MRKLLFLALFSGLIPSSSCTKCGKPVKDFHIISFQLNTADLTGKPADTTQYLPYDEIGKALSVKEKVDIGFKARPDFSLFSNSAIACSPRYPEAVEKISGIDIIARSQLNTISSNINPGDTVTQSFSLKQNGADYMSVSDYLDSNVPIDFYDNIYFIVREKPLAESAFKFDLIITLSDNSVHTFTDQMLRIK